MTDKEIIASQAQQIKLLKEKAISLEEVASLLEQVQKSIIKRNSAD